MTEIDAAAGDPQDSVVTAEAVAESAAEEEWQETWRRRLDLVATAVLALAAILTAWSAFQSAKFSGLQAAEFASAGANRTESTRFDTRAGQQAQVDIATFLNWLEAANSDLAAGLIDLPPVGTAYEPTPGTLSGFLFARMRPEFVPAFDAWLATNPYQVANSPATPFEMPEYQLAAAIEADSLKQQAEAHSATALEHNQQSDDYVLMAVIFASVLFFMGLSSKLKNPKSGLVVLLLGLALFLGAVITLATFPIEI